MTEIRSYRRVFELERRLYRIDRLRLNPAGVPVRGAVYFLVLVLAGLVGGSLPLLGAAARMLPWYVRDLAAPAASAALLAVIRVDGRPFHVAMHALLRYRLQPRRLSGLRACPPAGTVWWPSGLLLLPDGSEGRMRRSCYCGPGAVLVAMEHTRTGGRRAARGAHLPRFARRADVVIAELPAARPMHSPQVIAIAAGARLLVRSSTRRRRA